MYDLLQEYLWCAYLYVGFGIVLCYFEVYRNMSSRLTSSCAREYIKNPAFLVLPLLWLLITAFFPTSELVANLPELEGGVGTKAVNFLLTAFLYIAIALAWFFAGLLVVTVIPVLFITLPWLLLALAQYIHFWFVPHPVEKVIAKKDLKYDQLVLELKRHLVRWPSFDIRDYRPAWVQNNLIKRLEAFSKRKRAEQTFLKKVMRREFHTRKKGENDG